MDLERPKVNRNLDHRERKYRLMDYVILVVVWVILLESRVPQ